MSGSASSNPLPRPSEQGSSSTGSSSPTVRSSGAYEIVGFDSGKEDQDDDWLEPPPAEVAVHVICNIPTYCMHIAHNIVRTPHVHCCEI